MKTYKVIISGKVQKVGYRSLALKRAKEYHLMGWVMNLPTGEVEMILQGDETKIEAMLRWCNKGPETALVEKIDFEEIKTFEEFKIFEIKKLK
jgi:acylphosphatase